MTIPAVDASTHELGPVPCRRRWCGRPRPSAIATGAASDLAATTARFVLLNTQHANVIIPLGEE